MLTLESFHESFQNHLPADNGSDDDDSDVADDMHNMKDEEKQSSNTSELDDDGSHHGSNSYSGSSSSKGGEGFNKTRLKDADRLAARETKAVTCSRILMVLVLLGVAIAAAVTVFKYTTTIEEEDFEVRFTDIAYQIISVYKINARKIKEQYTNFAVDISSYAQGTESPWPFVTIPNFEAKALSVIDQTGARTMATIHHIIPQLGDAWIGYSMGNSNIWKQESFDYHHSNRTAMPTIPFFFGSVDFQISFPEPLTAPMQPYGFFSPLWQTAPILEGFAEIQNFDAFHFDSYPPAYKQLLQANGPILSSDILVYGADTQFGNFTPESYILVPIYRKVVLEEERRVDDIVGTVMSLLPWENYFKDLLPEGIDGITLVVSNTCNQTFTYEINGPEVAYLGIGDMHDSSFDEYVIETTFSPFEAEMPCAVTLSLYPTLEFESTYATNKPLVYTIAVLGVFLLTAAVFFLYDCFVERRQSKVLLTAEKSTAIVSSLFPQQVADKLMEQEEEKKKKAQAAKAKKNSALGSIRARGGGGDAVMLGQVMGGVTKGGSMMAAGQIQNDHVDHIGTLNDEDNGVSKPIAELFPSATVLFADIVGFTAWSSTREPCQVFELLEEIYSSFDRIARRKKVFKVETIGDCYMAATGLPEKRKDHAVLMARFAKDCLRKMLHVVRKLEIRLGPDTAELGMRIGIHSGPVTAGVLRGEKARFQLFGDTVNTAARMESTGAKNKIHMSEETALLIRKAAHKDIWTSPRKEQVEAKGKGLLKTHWLSYSNQSRGGRSVSSSGTLTASALSGSSNGDVSESCADFSEVDYTTAGLSEVDCTETANSGDDIYSPMTTEILEDSRQKKLDRSIDWVVHNLLRLLKRVVAMRGGIDKSLNAITGGTVPSGLPLNGVLPMDEVRDIIELPSQEKKYPVYPSNVELPAQVVFQLRDYVKMIASMYNLNNFHSFEHATHVTQSVTKLLTRVVTPANHQVSGFDSEGNMLHQYTYGITSDPLAQFSVVFSALIHDVDHPGIPNSQLIQENVDLADHYKSKSVAEQNSIALAWDLLMEPQYAELRSCIYTDTNELQRFRQLVVNTVLATDIVDKELGAARKKRWEKAFSTSPSNNTSSRNCTESALIREDSNRKATIVIEHLIQASDVAHTMQHWHVYLKWNQRFFNECYKGYLEGRTKQDPSDSWYKGELGFFDFYIIPLAKKLQECQVFGVASEEYLQYAEANRREWEAKGNEIVKKYVEQYKQHGASEP